MNAPASIKDVLDELPPSPDVLRWMYKLGSHPFFTSMIINNPLLMGAWHKVVGDSIKWPAELKKSIVSSGNSVYSVSHNFLEITSMLESRFGIKIAGDYAKAYTEGFTLSSHYRNNQHLFTTQLKKALGKTTGTMELGHMAQMIRLLQLNKYEETMMKMALSQELYPYFRVFIELLMEVPENARQVWSVLLSNTNTAISQPDTISILSDLKESTLVSLGVFDLKSITKPPSFSEAIFTLMLDIRTDLLSVLVSPLASKTISDEAAPRIDAKELEMAQYLTSLDRPNKQPISIMVWGAKAVDKVTVASQVAKERIVWMLNKTKKEGLLPVHVILAQRLLSELDPKSCLLIPEAGELLSKNTIDVNFFGMSLKEEIDSKLSKAEQAMLLDFDLDCIWIAHSVKRINPAAASSFTYHLEVKAGSRIERMRRIEDTLATLELSDETKREISKFNGLTEQQLTNALQGSTMLPTELKESYIISAIGASSRALDLRSKDPIRKSVTKYSLDYINASGRMSPDKLIKALQYNLSGSVCFFGLPGTGKTQFAEHIATVIEKPLIMKRGSDLLDKYVGETEKHISAMFDEAEDESAILFLDEADSFLRNRTLSKESWEVTRVNELLQRMERFSGIFICATNLFSHLDNAALRRFTFKLEFLPLTEKQRVKMFIGETDMDKTNGELVEHITEELMMLRDLTPGDFATVKRQANLMGEQLTVEDWLARLKSEVELKSREMMVSD